MAHNTEQARQRWRDFVVEKSLTHEVAAVEAPFSSLWLLSLHRAPHPTSGVQKTLCSQILVPSLALKHLISNGMLLPLF